MHIVSQDISHTFLKINNKIELLQLALIDMLQNRKCAMPACDPGKLVTTANTIGRTSSPSCLRIFTSLVDNSTMAYRAVFTETTPHRTIYLDCPYAEKHLVKATGAQWDEVAKQWWVPPHLYPMLEQFNAWRPDGNIYLTCSFGQKDQVKQAGAKWDSQVKRWYVTLQRTVAVPAKFTPWLCSTKTMALPKSLKLPQPKAPKRGHAQEADLLRINESMTVGQLRDECRLRNITGVSGKTKGWLLEQLGLGTVWQVASRNSATNLEAVAESVEQVAAKVTKKAAEKDAKVETKAGKKVDGKNIDKVKKTTAAKAMTEIPPIWTLPRVSSSLTIAQLLHELFHRHLHIKGVSSKPKPWYLAELGDGSIRTTSPDIASIDLSGCPLVSKSMTVAQLLHELLARLPSMKGLSNKSKDDLLKLAGVGSIWTTASPKAHAAPKKIAKSKSALGGLKACKKPPPDSTPKRTNVSTTVKKEAAPKAAPRPKKEPPPDSTPKRTNVSTTVKKEAAPTAATRPKKEPPVSKKTAKSKQAPCSIVIQPDSGLRQNERLPDSNASAFFIERSSRFVTRQTACFVDETTGQFSNNGGK
jgi:hypothetical protein